jgi:energy-coupling factor transporter ATP-binding protein EcfA2
MKNTIEYNRFFAYSEEHNKCFYAEFKKGVNIIYGKNTSGKSTLLQAINYTFGINDEKHKLSEVLAENVIFRIDIQLVNSSSEDIVIIRDSDFLFIKREGQPIKKFLGINGNKSEEHKELKKYISELFGFNLFLESTGEYKLGSIESIFLPYYVAQDYGWVLALKSFRGLDYFRNFKFDYYDYYLGINNEYDREVKQRLEAEKNIYENEIKFLVKTEKGKDELQLSKLKDEAFISKSAEYIEQYKADKSRLIHQEKEYLVISNKIKFLEERRKILLVINRNTKDQNPIDNDCPTCHQKLTSSIEGVYEYFQDIDDTIKQLNVIKKEISKKTGTLNSIKNDIVELRERISIKYSILKDYQIENLSVSTWIDNKANVHLSNKILLQIGELEIQLQGVVDELEKFKTDEELKQERKNKDFSFIQRFNQYLTQLNVRDFKEDYSLYRMKLFPQQGVELLKTLLAYYFAFNELIKGTSYVHRLPFVMDAIFKEDVDEGNRKLILNFINRNKPIDTQIIFSVAESKDNNKTAIDYDKEHFNESANLIKINTEEERAFLAEYDERYEEIKNDTLKLIE